MPPKKAPAKKAAPKKVEPKLVEVTVTAEHLAANPEWVDEGLKAGDVIEIAEGDFNEPEESPEATEPEAPVEETPVKKETTEKEVVVSKKGNKTSNKDTIKKAKENQKVFADLEKVLGDAAEYEILSNLKRNGVEYKEGDVVEFEDCLAVRKLVDDGIIKAI